jgi:AcrR family transcriptional regulator
MSLAEPRARLVAAARALLAARGREELTMRRLGEAVGVRAPSLYKHFAAKGDLERALAASGWEELAGLAAAWCGERGADLARVERGYRRFATENRNLYRVMAEAVTPAQAAAITSALTPLAGSAEAARTAFASLHGATLLELAGA